MFASINIYLFEIMDTNKIDISPVLYVILMITIFALAV